MGFFKKLGKSLKGGIKGVTKMISLKNIQMIASGKPVNFGRELVTRFTKGVLQKDKKRVTAGPMPEGQPTYEMAGKGPNFGEILGGAMSGAGTVLAGSTEAGQLGANLADSTMTVWLKRNWLKVVGAVLGVTAVILVITRATKKPAYRGRR